jgi:pimeloyl-ACP methyl ester carboxylesterase
MMTWYLHIAPRLARHHRVVMFDLRGHGKSDRAASGYDLETLSRDLDCVVQQLGLGAAVMVGHSYGALVALRFASLRPDSVSKLVLVEAPIAHAPEGENDSEAFLGLNPEKMLEALPPDLRGAISGGRRRTRFLEAMRFFATESSIVQDMQVAVTEAGRCLPPIGCADFCRGSTEHDRRALRWTFLADRNAGPAWQGTGGIRRWLRRLCAGCGCTASELARLARSFASPSFMVSSSTISPACTFRSLVR